jgi:hypothetical protein
MYGILFWFSSRCKYFCHLLERCRAVEILVSSSFFEQMNFEQLTLLPFKDIQFLLSYLWKFCLGLTISYLSIIYGSSLERAGRYIVCNIMCDLFSDFWNHLHLDILNYTSLDFLGKQKKILNVQLITLFTFLNEPVIRTDSLGISHIYICIFYFIFFLEDCNKARTFSIPTVFSHLDKFLSFHLKNDSVPFLFIRKCRNHKSQFFNWSSSTFITMIGRANYF